MSKFKRYERYKDSGVEWIGEIPEHWEVGRLKSSIKSCRNGIWGDEPQGDNDDVACIRVADFNRTNMEIEVTDLTIRNVPASKQKMYLLKHGDLLIEKSGGGEKQPVGFVTIFNHNIPAVYANFIAKMELVEEKAYSGFYKYVHSAMYSVRLNVRSIKQTTGIQNLDTNYYFEESVIYPPLNEQKSIANFLDQKTAEIDGLIADKEKLIELLQEKRQAVITEAVTKGLNPNVRMKDSGVEWIGEIPEHWEVTKLKYITNQIIDGTHSTPQYIDDGIPFLRVTDITNSRGKPINLNEVKYISEEEHKELAKRCNPKKGDLLVSKNGTIGIPKVIDWDYEFSIFVSLCLIKVNKKVDVYYCSYYFESNLIDTQIAFGGKTNTITNLHLDKIKEFIVLLPPVEEQKVITKYINNKTDEIDLLINDIQLQIQKLKEYRQSLISEAVTGKINVRDYANN